MMSNSNILNYFLAVTTLVLVLKLVYKEKPETNIIVNNSVPSTEESRTEKITITTTHQTRVWLTVAESKRLIARGLKEYPPIKERLKKGTIILTKGTTNTYVAEEFINEKLVNGEYVLGHILPASGGVKLDKSKNRAELVFTDGVVQDVDYRKILPSLKQGDIVIKGGNVLNYEKKQAGVLVGHPTGGTIGVLQPSIEEKNLHLIVPIGLEKDSSQDIDILSELMNVPHKEVAKKTPFLWTLKGDVFTEIEAITQFATVEVIQMASGGIGGAEGATTLCIRGEKEEVEKAMKVIEGIRGEPSFVQ